MAKVKVGISRLNSDGLIGKGQKLVEEMTGNAVYIGQQADLPPITDAVDALIEANNAVIFDGGKVAHANKRICDAALRTLINALAPKVQIASGGDEMKILSGGWDVVKQPEQGELPAMPDNFKSIYTPYDGNVKMHWRGNKLAIYYQLEMLDDKGLWVVATTTSKCTTLVGGLTSGKEYSFRVFAMGAKGASPITDGLVAKAA
ncbi:MAG: fibronectin type III domain-containing protein [Flavobacteriales bacterium]